MKNAACRGMDTRIFFPGRGEVAKTTQALTVCFSCSVRPQCRDLKERTKSKGGIWAGVIDSTS